MQNIKEFQESITQEIDVIKNRVRNLIGGANWGEEGRFKEAVLKNILKSFLPKNMSVGTGFILKAENSSSNISISKQLDIIIYDNTLPLLFSEGDFIITTINNVKGVIEVKSKITSSTFQTVIEQFDNSLQPFVELILNMEAKLFLGVFAFEYEGNFESLNIDFALKSSKKIINHISLGTNYFIRFWGSKYKYNLLTSVDCENDFYNCYKIANLSFSYFISNIIDMIYQEQEDRSWFLFPITETKEFYRTRSICME